MNEISIVYLFLLGIIAYVHAIDINVNVGGPNGEIIFDPQTVSANVGDNIIFTWISGKHSVIESDAAGSCTKSIKPNAFSSDGAFVPPNVLTLPVINIGKTWFYCDYANHCANGMYGTLIVNGDPFGSIAPPAPSPVTNVSIPGKTAPSSTVTPSDTAIPPVMVTPSGTVIPSNGTLSGAGPTFVNSPYTYITPIMIAAIIGALICGILLSVGTFFLYKAYKRNKNNKDIMLIPGDVRNNIDVLLIPRDNENNYNSRGSSTEVYNYKQGANHRHETNHGQEANHEQEVNHGQESNHDKETDYHGQEVISISENNVNNNLKDYITNIVRQELMQNQQK
ncbi:hypothetical protein RCL_jg9307.t1 [Rhizophagus clarus]|uniref:Phytocyanin domain-containing protein n=1 Tax=Rhizophagus clarus TaxID=94130 RepID=A0A8H3MA35_9GLOM|nr:hypothetical protein RCL_jg9307.t1 [Rhizophagus clarus]